MQAAGDFEAMPKKEALRHVRELEKLQRNLGGISGLDRLPDAIFVIDTKKEHIAVTEANKLGLPVVAVVDTNCDPDVITYVIPGNDDAIRSGALMCRVVADAVIEGRWIAQHRPAAGPGRGAAQRPGPAAAPAAASAASAARRPRATAGRAPRPPTEVPRPAGRRRRRPGPAAGRRPRLPGTGRRPPRRRPRAPRAPSRPGPADGRRRRPGPGPPPGAAGGLIVADFTAKDVQTLRQADRRRDARRQAGARGDRRRHGGGDPVAPRAGPGRAGQAGRPRASEGAVAVVRRRRRRPSSSCGRETDFVAKSAEFVAFADDAGRPGGRQGRGRRSTERPRTIERLKTTLKENISVGRVVRLEAGRRRGRRHLPAPAGRPRRQRGGRGPARAGRPSWPTTSPSTSPSPARPTCAARTCRRTRWPPSGRRWRRSARNEGKPEAALPKIVEGRLNGWFKERVPAGPAVRQGREADHRRDAGPGRGRRFAQVVIGS